MFFRISQGQRLPLYSPAAEMLLRALKWADSRA